MPNRKEHLDLGGLSGGCAAGYGARDQELLAMLAEIFGGYLLGRVGAKLPDVIDPPTCPNHRSIGHGVIPNGIAFSNLHEFAVELRRDVRKWAAEAKQRARQTEDPVEQLIEYGLYLLLHMVAGAIAGLPAGHISHLLADSVTKKSLPLIA